jgi:hypothetical protein
MLQAYSFLERKAVFYQVGLKLFSRHWGRAMCGMCQAISGAAGVIPANS